MPEEKRLIATIIPKIDQTALSNAVRQAFQEAFSANINISGGLRGGDNVSTAVGDADQQAVADAVQQAVEDTSESVSQAVQEAVSDAVSQTRETVSEAVSDMNRNVVGNTAFDDARTEGQSAQAEHDLNTGANKSSDTERGAKAWLETLGKKFKLFDDSEEGQRKKEVFQMQLISAGVNQISNLGMSLLKGTFGILEDIYGRLKAASPLLQTVESLFNLAMQLFFMPIGNALAETVLPATLDLVDAVVDMWDKFEGKSLPEMIGYAITEGAQLIGDYFINIGESLQGENDLLNAIGNLLTNIGEFIKNDAVDVLTSLLNVMTFILEHLKEIISVLIAMYTLNAALQILQLYATAIGESFAGKFGAGLAVAGMASALVGSVGYGWMTAKGFADGGYVPATPGGVPAIIGEGGEGEYIIPESKMGGVGGNSYYITINGMTDAELKSYINDIVSQQISQSRLRSGF